jgi:3-hydroxymyristoyl/3-hydroxydecanoyl-(acyl carrier protein) dehydratase
MLLVDGIDIVDLDGQAVRGHRAIRRSDVGFDGHFDGEPIYPGVLLIETMGQLGLTLLHFSSSRAINVPASAIPPRVRATHIHYAAFLAPVIPGDQLVLHAQVVDSGLTTIAAGQAFKSGTLAAYAVSEVYVDE